MRTTSCSSSGGCVFLIAMVAASAGMVCGPTRAAAAEKPSLAAPPAPPLPVIQSLKLVPAALTLKPGFAQQTWACKTTHDSVWLCHDDDAFSFDAADWA